MRGAQTRRAPSSCDVLGLGGVSTVAEEFVDQVEASELVANTSAELCPCHEHDAARGVEQYEWRAFGEFAAGANLGRYDDSTTISHYYRVCPTHVAAIPLASSGWVAARAVVTNLSPLVQFVAGGQGGTGLFERWAAALEVGALCTLVVVAVASSFLEHLSDPSRHARVVTGSLDRTHFAVSSSSVIVTFRTNQVWHEGRGSMGGSMGWLDGWFVITVRYRRGVLIGFEAGWCWWLASVR